MARRKHRSLDAYLKAAKKTQARLAIELGISAIFLSEIRRKKRTPSLPLALRIASHCGLPIESLVMRPQPAPAQPASHLNSAPASLGRKGQVLDEDRPERVGS